MSSRLWAKGWNENLDGPAPPNVLLRGHLQDVLTSAEQVLDATAKDQLHAFGLNPSIWLERFRRVVRLSAAVHDLGKANSHFQGMITRQHERIGRLQGMRHEWISWFILQQPELRNWLSPILGELLTREDDWTILLWAVAGHHPAFRRESPPTTVPDGAGLEMRLFLGSTGFQECLLWLAETFGLDPVLRPALLDKTISLNDVLRQIQHEVDGQATLWIQWQAARPQPGLPSFVAAVKNCLVAADIAGSALPRQVLDVQQRNDWVYTAFKQRPTRADLDSVITDRLTDAETGEVHELLPFQRQVADLASDVTFIKAGCGSGKTLAAYHWARERHPNRQLYMCYPTTGTATEGFRDYVFDSAVHSPKFGARLFHGRADVDLKLILGTEEQDNEVADLLTRIESLDTWSTPIVTCTVDTVLGVMQNNRRGLYAWPALAGGAFVFDEIHSYDSDLFGALLRFIRELRGVPILLMTASLPGSRHSRLRRTVHARNSHLPLVQIDGPAELETLPRYHRLSDVNDVELVAEVSREMSRPDRPGKVLWVCNTVNRALAAAEQCRLAGLKPLVYHSRFRYEDRVRQHAHVIDAFGNKQNAALAVCTQVAEMSLDLSATLLVTELSPISALIQRLGRLNRRARTPGQPTMPFVITIPRDTHGNISHLPYAREELDLAQSWLSRLPTQITQRHLAECWETLSGSSAKEDISTECHWLDGGPQRNVKELRKPSTGITVVLQRDLAALKSTGDAHKRLTEVTLPMSKPPASFDWKNGPKFRGIPIASDDLIDYQFDRGAEWR